MSSENGKRAGDAVYILGISALFHDSAAALLRDGQIVAAAQEERFTRKKQDDGFPTKAIEYCLSWEGIGPTDLDVAVFYEKPLVKFERLLETHLAVSPEGFEPFRRALPDWSVRKLDLPNLLRTELGSAFGGEVCFADHHESHAASAFFPSPYEEAAILTLDAVGEWSTSSLGYGTREPDHADARDAVPALGRHALLRVHLLHGLQGELG